MSEAATKKKDASKEEALVVAKKKEEVSMLLKAFKAASEGAVGAVVGAFLASIVEPVVNKVLRDRVSVGEALKEHSPEMMRKMFFEATLPTNFIKFPFFEVVNMIMNTMTVPPAVRGTVTGIVFTTTTLPMTNYRFKKSVGSPIGGISGLYQAYLPTVIRDIIYGIARNLMMGWLKTADPTIMDTPPGKARAMFMTVLFSCFLSAPGNELRGYLLQEPSKKLPFFKYFDPVKTLRSTSIGGLIMAFSLAVAAYLTPLVESFVKRQKAQLLGKEPNEDKVPHPDAKAKP